MLKQTSHRLYYSNLEIIPIRPEYGKCNIYSVGMVYLVVNKNIYKLPTEITSKPHGVHVPVYTHINPISIHMHVYAVYHNVLFDSLPVFVALSTTCD